MMNLSVSPIVGLDVAIPLFVYTMIAFGIAYVIGFSKITGWARQKLRSLGFVASWLVALAECPACLGFWIGVGAVVLGVDPLELKLEPGPVIAFGFYTCGANLFLSLWSGLIYGGSNG